MKKLLFLLMLPSVCLAEGPIYRHKEAPVQMEFENVYQDLRVEGSTVIASGSTNYIQNSAAPTTTTQQFNVASGTVSGKIQVSSVVAPGELRFDTLTANPVIIKTNGSITSSMTAAGEIIQPRQPCFLIRLNARASNVTGDGTTLTVTFQTEVFDQGSNVANSSFTAPVDGKYLFTFAVGFEQILTTHTDYSARVVTSNRTYIAQSKSRSLAETYNVLSASVIADMDANDIAYLQVQASGSTKTVDLFGGASNVDTFFAGELSN